MQPSKQIAKTTSQHIAFANKHAKWDMMCVGHFYNLCVVLEKEKKGNYLPLGEEENCLFVNFCQYFVPLNLE